LIATYEEKQIRRSGTIFIKATPEEAADYFGQIAVRDYLRTLAK
jgi:hypothetical protein